MRGRSSISAGVAGAALSAALVATVTGAAFAYFSATGAGNASAGVSKLTAPTVIATPAIGGTVALSWGTVTPPGPGAVTYAVSRDGGAPAGTCPSPPGRTTGTSCTDGEVGVGTHSYVVIVYWRSWSASSATATAKITVGPVTHLDLKAASTSPVAGATDNLTITAQDANDSTVTTYTGSHNLTFSGASASPGGTNPTVSNSSGTAVAFGSPTAISFSSGVAKVSSSKNGVMRLYRSGATSVGVSEDTIAGSADLALTVTPATTSKIAMVLDPAAPTAGERTDLTITVSDTYGNPAPAYTGSHDLTFSGASASSGGNAPTVSDSSGADVPFGEATAIEFDAGVANATTAAANGVLKLYKSGTSSLKVSDGTFTSSAKSAVVAAAPASLLSLSAASTTPTAGAVNNLTATAFDPYGNTATSYTGSHDLVFSGATASPNGTQPTVVNSAGTAVAFGSPTAISFSSGVAKVSSSKNGVMKLNRAGETGVEAGDGTISSTPLAVTVKPASAARLAFSGVVFSGGVPSATCLFTCSVTGLGNSGTITARVSVTDSFGNTASGVGSGHGVKVSSTGGTIGGSPLTINSSGPAESTTQFTYTAKSSGNYSDTITAATSSGTTYTSATLTAGR